MTRARWMEDHDLFEGVGAHELNPRYDPQDGDGYDHDLRLAGTTATLRSVTRLQGLAAATAPPVRLDGFDASHYQYDVGPVDVDAMHAQAPVWVAWKATQGINYVDPSLALIRPRLTAAYARRMFYHWLSSSFDPQDQAEHFLATVGKLGPGDGVMCDAEEAGITAQSVDTFCAVCEMDTRRPAAIYSGAYVAGGTIWANTRLRESGYGARPMHLAAYTTEAKARALPGVADFPWDAWQNSSSGHYPWSAARWDTNRIDALSKYDLACATTPTGDTEMIDIVTNAESRTYAGAGPYPPGVLKYAVADDGRLRHLTETELEARGIVNTPSLGNELTNAKIDELGEWTPGTASSGAVGVSAHGTWTQEP